MVKGISKQVIVVNPPDKSMFDQAIFILSEDAVKGDGVTDKMLLREAQSLITPKSYLDKIRPWQNALYVLFGAVLTGTVWLLTMIL